MSRKFHTALAATLLALAAHGRRRQRVGRQLGLGGRPSYYVGGGFMW